MDVWLLVLLAAVDGRMLCGKLKAPLELGQWQYHLKHIDSAVVENLPVSISAGQLYVYDNYFPGYIIKYIHVDNLAMRSCGASAVLKNGGVGSSNVLIVLHAGINQEIRSVVDIWGEKIPTKSTDSLKTEEIAKNPKSLSMFKEIRAVSHNKGSFL